MTTAVAAVPRKMIPMAPEDEDYLEDMGGHKREMVQRNERPDVRQSVPTPRQEMEAPQVEQMADGAMLLTVRELIDQTRCLRADRARPPPDVQFAGRDFEDPAVFIQLYEEWMTREQIPSSRSVILAKGCLRGEAKQWADRVVGLQCGWGLFRERFLAQYNSYDCMSDLTQRLFSEAQLENEDTFQFITTKMALFERVAPDIPEQRRVAIIRDLLRFSTRVHIRPSQVGSLHELIQTAEGIERDFAKEERRKKGCTSCHHEKKKGPKPENQGPSTNDRRGNDETSRPPAQQKRSEEWLWEPAWATTAKHPARAKRPGTGTPTQRQLASRRQTVSTATSTSDGELA